MQLNKLKPNLDKIELLVVSGRSNLEFKVSFWMGLHPLKEQIHSFGVLLCQGLQLEVVHVLVTFRLDYCNTHYVGLPFKSIWKFQLVQNAAAGLLTELGCTDQITLILAHLHWLLFVFQAQLKVLDL